MDTANSSGYSARALLAPGSHYRRLRVSGESSYIGVGIHLGATCDGPFYQGQHVAVRSEPLPGQVRGGVALLVRGGNVKGSQVIQEKVLNTTRLTCASRGFDLVAILALARP